MKEPNRLIDEISPYLLQHARNPVDWFPWGPEALAKAKKEDKPILLSIGYSACHWCHVMAHESFEDAAIACKMNELFVNIKVDREERPDIDAIYMKSIVAMTGHGGWPLNVFLTPDQEPYLGGTYFPLAPQYNRPGFAQVLEQAHDLYKNRKNNLQTRVDKVLQNLQSAEEKKPATSSPEESLIEQAVAILAERYDAEAGGFGQGMKFPEPMIYSLLLRHWLRTESDETLKMLDKSLTRMAEGGMYDQLGGGFHRYSTDRHWRVPHFEKMLIDNALLAKLYLEMFQATKQEIYKTVPDEIFEYVLREMTSPQGYFYSSQDADTDGREGEFYVWELKELLNLLGPRPAKVLARAYGLTPAGNFERKNVPHIQDSMETIAEQEGMPIFEVQHLLNSGKKTLFETRQRRKLPERDEKMITAWNGLMITAFATGFSVLRDSRWRDAALRCADFIWSNMWRENRLLRIHKDGESRIDGCLDDYASLLQGFIALYEATFDTLWIERARELADRMIAEFYDEEAGGFFMTGNSHEKLIVRLKNAADEAMPSANSIAALSLWKLAALTGNKPYQKKAEQTVRAFQSRMQSSPAAYTGLLGAVDALSISPTEIVFAGPRDHAAAEEMLRVVYQDYRPNKVVIWSECSKTAKHLPLAQGRSAIKGEPTVYLCKQQTCQPPVQSAEALQKLLGRPPEIRLNIFDEDKKAAEVMQKEQTHFLNAMSEIFKHSGLGGKK